MRNGVALAILASALNWQSVSAQMPTASQPTGSASLPGGPLEAPIHQTMSPANCPTCGVTPTQAMFEGARPAPQFWFEFDYLSWWIKGVSLKPPTLTSGSTADAIPGAIGQAHTQILLGNHQFEFGALSGVRPIFGFAINEDHTMGFEFEGFLLEHGVARQGFVSNPGTPNTYLPYIDTNGVQQALPFTVPGQVLGTSFTKGQSWLGSAEGNYFCGCVANLGDWNLRASMLAGVRYLDLSDEVVIRNHLVQASNPNITATGEDTFSTRNEFFGGQVGVKVALQWYAWTVEATAKLGIGEVHQTSSVSGSPLLETTGGGGTLQPGPLLALGSNIGRQSADEFVLLPDFGVKLRLDCKENVAVTLGYNYLYWNKILSPGDQMDPRVNITQLPNRGPFTGPSLPAPQFVRSNFFAQGLSAGIEFKY